MKIYDPALSGTTSLPSITAGTTETNIVVVAGDGALKYRSDLSLQGTAGTVGPQGTAGSNGTQGTAGTNGTQGTAGIDGTQGTAGSNGIQGTAGTQGTAGAGTQGTAGTNGTQGTVGTQGTIGTTGLQGATGPQGASVSVSGTNNTITKFTSTTTIGNSAITDNGTNTVQVSARDTVVSTNWDIGGSYPEALTVIGTYASMCFRNSNANYKWLYHTDASGVMRWYGGSGYTDSTWTNYMSLSTGGSLSTTGDITAYSSDKRLKTNIKNIPHAMDKIMSINGVSFDWNQTAKDFGFVSKERETDIGVLAQEIQAILPELVTLAPFDKDENDKSKSGENYLTVRYDKLSALLIEGIKEQQTQINELKELVQQLSSK
jgi:hypothetical protein